MKKRKTDNKITTENLDRLPTNNLDRLETNYERTEASTSNGCTHNEKNKEYICTDRLLEVKISTQSDDVYEFTDD